MTEPQLLTMPQTAELLGCSRMHIYRLIKSGQLEAMDISLPNSKRSKTRIKATELERYLTTRIVVKEN